MQVPRDTFNFPVYILLAYRPTQLTPEGFLGGNTGSLVIDRVVEKIERRQQRTIRTLLTEFNDLPSEIKDDETISLISLAKKALKNVLETRTIEMGKKKISLYEFLDLIRRTGICDIQELEKITPEPFKAKIQEDNSFMERIYNFKPPKFTENEEFLLNNPELLKTAIKDFVSQNDSQDLLDFIWVIRRNELSLIDNAYSRKRDKIIGSIGEAINEAVDRWITSNHRSLLKDLKQAGFIPKETLAYRLSESHVTSLLKAYIRTSCIPASLDAHITSTDATKFLQTIKSDLLENASEQDVEKGRHRLNKLIANFTLTEHEEPKKELERLYGLFSGNLIQNLAKQGAVLRI